MGGPYRPHRDRQAGRLTALLRRTAIAGLVAALAAWWALEIYARRRPSPGDRFDAVIVAGARLRRDGRPSVALLQRVERGVDEWSRTRAPALVLTGGGRSIPRSEARAAADLAMERGVPQAALVVEERSTSTDENAEYARMLLTPNVQRVLVVSDTYHGFRCRQVFGRRFAEVELSLTRPPLPEWLVMGLREVAAVAWYAVRGRL